MIEEEDIEINEKPFKNVLLKEYVINFFNGLRWIIVPLKIMEIYSIIHTKYYDDEKQIDISIIVCPLTLRAINIKGKYKFKKYINGIMALINEKEDIVQIDIGLKIDNEYNIISNKRYEVKIRTLRNSLIEFQDCLYLHIKHDITNNNIIDSEYYNNLLNIDGTLLDLSNIPFHPKTLVNIVQYISQYGEHKQTIIIGFDASIDNVSGYDTKTSLINKYLIKFYDEIINKNAYIIPILLIHAINIYKNAKIKYLTKIILK